MKIKPKPSVKKLVRSHDNLILFLTKEARQLGWDDNTYLKITIEGGKVVVEKGMQV